MSSTEKTEFPFFYFPIFRYCHPSPTQHHTNTVCTSVSVFVLLLVFRRREHAPLSVAVPLLLALLVLLADATRVRRRLYPRGAVVPVKQGRFSASKPHAHSPITNFLVSHLMSCVSSSSLSIYPSQINMGGSRFCQLAQQEVYELSIKAPGGGPSFCSVYDNDDNDNDGMVTQISRFAGRTRLKNRRKQDN